MVLWSCYESQEKGRQYDKVDIKQEESFIACGESDLTEEILKDTCGIRRLRKNIWVKTEFTAILDNN